MKVNLQHIYAIVFLIGYMILTGIMMWFIFQFIGMSATKLPEWAIAFISTIFGAMSSKVSTITDYLFGSSQGSKNKELMLHKNIDKNGQE